MQQFVSENDFVISKECRHLFQSEGLFSLNHYMDYLKGSRVCHKPGRSVFRFVIDGRVFYLKRNRFHWGEFLKRLSRLRLPPRSGQQEWDNILKMQTAKIPTVKPVAFGEKHFLGIEIASFSVTEEIYGAEPLDELIEREWTGSQPLTERLEKRRIIKRVAEFAGAFHRQGMNHQDFYLNHFFIDQKGMFYLLDLQRVQSRHRVPERYLVKDLAQLFYSSLRFPSISQTDKVYFLLSYFGVERLDKKHKRLVTKISKKNARIARHDAKHRLKRIRRGELSA